MSDISKSDWKLLNERLPEWQEKYMGRLLDEYMEIIKSSEKPSERFHRLESRLKQDRKNPGVQLQMDKSEAMFYLALLIKNNVITMADLEGFSAGLKESIKQFQNIALQDKMTYIDVVNKAKSELSKPDHYGDTKIEFVDCPTWQKGNQINLWTYWQGYQIKDPENGVDILLVGQDWGNPNRDTRTIELIERIQRGDDIAYHPDKSPTDMRLRDMFTYLGCDIDSKTPGKRLFFTNYCLGYRGGSETGGMTRQILDADKELFNDLVSVIKPRIIICLGKLIYEQVSGKIADRFTEMLKENGPFISPYPGDESIKVYGVPHCGVWGVRNIGGEEAMRKLWQQIAEDSGL